VDVQRIFTGSIFSRQNIWISLSPILDSMNIKTLKDFTETNFGLSECSKGFGQRKFAPASYEDFNGRNFAPVKYVDGNNMNAQKILPG
jgi:hypothetical protein